MKLVLVISTFATLLSLNSFAGNGVERFESFPDFSEASDLSEEARERIQLILHTRCQPAYANASEVEVTNLKVSENQIDFGVVDYTYSFDVSLIGDDHGDRTEISMVLEEASFTNPRFDKFNLKSLTASPHVCK